MSGARPTLAELRPVAQPTTTMGRVSGEHWAGTLYMRSVSIRLTRLLVPTRITPDAVTVSLIGCGLVAAAVLTVPTLWAAIVAGLVVQLQELLDCTDGELARWRRQTGPVGIYLDRIAHYVTDAGLAAAVGVSAAGGPTHLNGWTTIGLGAGLLIVLTKAETDLVHMARASAGLPPVTDTAAIAAPRRTGAVANARRLARYVRFNRALLAIELSWLAILAAVGDAAAGTKLGLRTLDVTLLVIAVIVALGHPLSILASSKLHQEPPTPLPVPVNPAARLIETARVSGSRQATSSRRRRQSPE